MLRVTTLRLKDTDPRYGLLIRTFTGTGDAVFQSTRYRFGVFSRYLGCLSTAAVTGKFSETRLFLAEKLDELTGAQWTNGP